MNPATLQSAVTYLAMALILIGVGGGSFILLRQAAAGSRRRARLAGEAASLGGGGALPGAAELVNGVRRIGHRMAITDPSKLSALRTRLVQAGFFSREAPAIYLGVRAVAMIAAISATVLTIPWALSGAGGMGAILVASLFAGAAVLGPDQVVKNRRAKLEREYRDGFPDLLDLLVASVEAGLS
ncbi:MAG: hypothetical protein ACYC8V_03860, partial [Caulobacteraceae bacterium]